LPCLSFFAFVAALLFGGPVSKRDFRWMWVQRGYGGGAVRSFLLCCAEESKSEGADEGGEEGKVAEPVPTIPPPKAITANAALCLDTVGQNRDFTPTQIAAATAFAKLLVEPLNRTEDAGYVRMYHAHVKALADAAAAAKAAEEAAAAGAESRLVCFCAHSWCCGGVRECTFEGVRCCCSLQTLSFVCGWMQAVESCACLHVCVSSCRGSSGC
jgi:hypothetical protein